MILALKFFYTSNNSLVPHPCHHHTKARSSKIIRTIFLKPSDIVPNNITVTNLHLKKIFFSFFLVIHPVHQCVHSYRSERMPRILLREIQDLFCLFVHTTPHCYGLCSTCVHRTPHCYGLCSTCTCVLCILCTLYFVYSSPVYSIRFVDHVEVLMVIYRN